MTEEKAKAEALERWYALPEAERSTRQQAGDFALKLALSGLTFAGARQPYQEIKRWLLAELRDV